MLNVVIANTANVFPIFFAAVLVVVAVAMVAPALATEWGENAALRAYAARLSAAESRIVVVDAPAMTVDFGLYPDAERAIAELLAEQRSRRATSRLTAAA